MPVKKAKKPSGSIRYLLFADRSLRKISLKKISERVRKAKPAARSARAKKPASRKPAAPPSIVSGRAIVVAIGVVVVAAVMLAARQPSAPSAQTPDTMVNTAAPESASAIEASHPANAAEPVQPPKRTERKKPQVSTQATPAAARTSALNVTPRREPEVETVKVTAVEPLKPASAPPVKPLSAESTQPAASVAEGSLTTVTGCLAAGDGAFWLKNASGADVPKSRSWKSGFFRKRPARIELLDATHALHLATYVGQQVAATGTLEDRELRARSVRRLAASCD